MHAISKEGFFVHNIAVWRTRGSSKGASSSFIGLMRVVVLKGAKIGEKVCSMGKVTRKRVYEGRANPNPLTPRRPTGQTDT